MLSLLVSENLTTPLLLGNVLAVQRLAAGRMKPSRFAVITIVLVAASTLCKIVAVCQAGVVVLLLLLAKRPRRELLYPLIGATLGVALYRHFGLDPVDYDTNILIEDGRAWLKAESSIRVFERLGLPWSLVAVARVLPRPVRDWLYGILARNRLRWFGARASCYRPDPSQADRFLT